MIRRFLGPAAALALIACREQGSELATYQAKVAEAVPKIEAAIGLPFRTPPVVEVRSRTQVREYLEKQLTDSLARQQVAGQESALKRLGLMPDTMSLERLLLDVLEEQVGGYYDPRAKVLYIVEGTEEEVAGLTVSHELIHALQDQHLNLDSVMRATGDDDRTSAAQATLEGQATYEGLRLMVGAEMADNLPGGWDRAREMIREQRARWPAFAAAPLVVQEMMLFPYLSGAEFARAFRARKPGETPYAKMPTSTEQILHPSRYLGEEVDHPTRVVLPPLAGVTTTYDNTLGEFTTRLFLYEHLRDQQAALSGGQGWDGDRFAAVKTPRGDGSVWVSVWDTQIDAGDFYMLMDRTIDRRYGPAPARTLAGADLAGMSSGRAYTVGGRAVSIRTGEINGRPVVIYVDLPAGDDLGTLDVRRIRLEDTAPTATNAR